MPIISWDKTGDRFYENGLDQGVLYLPNGSAVPWNGLTSIIEEFDKQNAPIYYDGMKIHDLITFGDFSASMKALTYPNEFLEIEGLISSRRGVYFGNQPPQLFSLCYRTKIGNDFDGNDFGYKIHLIYNVTAIPSGKAYESLTNDPSVIEFEWNITAIPEDIPGFRPTAHVVIDSRNMDPWLLEELEEMLYGSSTTFAALIPMAEFITYINEWYRIKIIDNGNGSWTALSSRPESIQFSAIEEGLVTIIGANAVHWGDGSFDISDTYDISDTPSIKFVDNGDGTWYATTEKDNIFSVDNNRKFEILNANAIFLGPETYQVSDS